jgi:antitoxin component YwqK of YwqJK toxin-antitoxin module
MFLSLSLCKHRILISVLCICTIASLSIALTSCSATRQQNSKTVLASINIIDRNGLSETINAPERLEQYEKTNFLEPQPYQKVLRVYARDPQGNMQSYITSYYPNSFVKQYLEVVNNRAFGTYKEWHSNGTLKLETCVIGGTADIGNGAEQTWLFDGSSQVWDEKGNLEATIPYVKGELEGVSCYYHTNNNIWKRIPYHKNLVEGTWEIYQENGELLQRSEYRKGLKEGQTLRYWDDQKLAAEETYSNGLLSYARYYDRNGQCFAQIDDGNGYKALFGKENVCELQEYHAGVLEGIVKVFDKSNRMVSLYHVKNGTKHGEEICYYETHRLLQDPRPKLSINWYDGKIQGITKTWYSNGVQESQREMSNNIKNGHNTAWYRDGSLMMIEEYDQDKITRGEYYSKGEKTPVSTINDGKGIATIFDADGNFLQKINYLRGRPRMD